MYITLCTILGKELEFEIKKEFMFQCRQYKIKHTDAILTKIKKIVLYFKEDRYSNRIMSSTFIYKQKP